MSRQSVRRNLLIVIIIFVVALGAAVFDYPRVLDLLNLPTPGWFRLPFKLGLDLQGGAQLVYKADVSQVVGLSPQEAMSSVRNVIERRANLFGVAEPVVQVSKVGDQWRLIVELPGVKNIDQAIQEIGATPFLEFRALSQEARAEGAQSSPDLNSFQPTALNGSHLERAQLGFDPNTGQPLVELQFTPEGTKLFAQITRERIGEPLAIYLDGSPISIPIVRSEITSGRAVITGNFTVDEARSLAQRMNAGALPVPIKLISQRSIGASLGEESLQKILQAGLWGLVALALFMLLMYREKGALALLALGIYMALLLAIFKLIPVTLTLAGIAGFVLSLGMAVDANVLIFERLRQEKDLETAFQKAWPAIRDGNLSTLMVALIIFVVATSFVKGFGLTLSLGVIVSLFTAVFVTRLLLTLLVARQG